MTHPHPVITDEFTTPLSHHWVSLRRTPDACSTIRVEWFDCQPQIG
jgi:hypothetical protein